jgi:hypothetical protein
LQSEINNSPTTNPQTEHLNKERRTAQARSLGKSTSIHLSFSRQLLPTTNGTFEVPLPQR